MITGAAALDFFHDIKVQYLLMANPIERLLRNCALW